MSQKPFTYAIFNPEQDLVLPDGKKYYNEVRYGDYIYLKYFKENPENWIEDRDSSSVTYSNYQKISCIKTYTNLISTTVALKANLAKMLNQESYFPKSIVFELYKGSKIPNGLSRQWNPEPGSLWFLKKSILTSYGGYDVFPIRATTKSSGLRQIEEAVRESNEVKKYRSNFFVLQQGIDRPILMEYNRKMYKFDIRFYALIVKVDSKTPAEFYTHRKFMTRRSLEPYDSESTRKEVMLTNTTFAGIKGVKRSDVTQVFDDSDDLYEPMFDVFSHLCNKHLRKLDKDILNPAPIINMIGIDFIFDEEGNPYILEINKSPALIDIRSPHYSPDIHTMFEPDFFDLTFNAFEKGVPARYSTENYLYVE